MFTLREELDLILQMDGTGGEISAVTKRMLRRTFDYGQTRAREIMVPYVNVSSVSNAATCRETLNMAGQKGHPLIPVYDGRVDRVVGQVNTMDLLGEADEKPIKSFIKPIRFVYGSKQIESLLDSFRRDGDRIAVVVDEFGGAEGVVGMQDIVERIVGDIENEHAVPHGGDRVSRDIILVKDGEYRIDPRIDPVALKQATGVQLPTDGNHYETLSGFLLEQFGDIPAPGESWEGDGVRFTVETCSEKRIESVRLFIAAG